MENNINNNVQAAVQTKSKSLTKTIVGLTALTLLASIATGGYAAVGSYSAATGINAFKMAGKSDRPALRVSLSDEVVSQTVVAGTKDQVFNKLVLDAGTLTKDVLVKEVNFKVSTGKRTSPSEVHSFRLFENDVQLATVNDPDADASTKVIDGETAIVTFTFTEPVIVSSGTSTTLTLKGDVASRGADGQDLDGAYAVGIKQFSKGSPIDVVEAELVNGAKLNKLYQYNQGPIMTFKSSGSLVFTLSASSPKMGLLPSNTNGVTLTTLNISAQDEDIKIEKIYFTGKAENGGGWDQIKAFYLSYGNTLISGSVTSTDSNSNGTVLIDMSHNPLIVPNGQLLTINLKADTADANGELGSAGSSFEGISVGINSSSDIVAKGVLSGISINHISLSNAFGYPQYLVRSTPTITTNDNLTSNNRVESGTIANGINTPIYAFSVHANPSGDIGLERVSFMVNSENVGLSNFKLINKSNNQIVSTTTLSNGIVRFNNINYVSAASNNPTILMVISDVSCTAAQNCGGVDSPGSYFSTQMLGSTNLPNPVPGTADELESENIRWTDFWQTPTLQFSDPDVFTANQWSNAFMLKEANGNNLSPISTAVIFSN